MKPIILKRKMYYSEFDKNSGDGFYPQLTLLSDSKKPFDIMCTTISFRLSVFDDNTFAWTQNDGSVIYGFDGTQGIQLLLSLNKEAKVYCKRIINIGGRVIYPATDNATYRVLAQKYRTK